MFVTPFKIHHWPTDAVKAAGYQTLIYIDQCRAYDTREYMAFLNGEGADRVSVVILDHEMSIDRDPPCNELVHILSKEGSLSLHPLGSLRRRYHFFDDFFSTFSDSRQIELPFTAEEIAGALWLDKSDTTLADCLECMEYLNPKKADEYFQLTELGDISDEALLELVNCLDEDDIADMIEAREYCMNLEGTYVPLPRGGRDRPALACILEYHRDDERLLRMFPKYPSYLSSTIRGHALRAKLLLTADFSQSREVLVGSCILIDNICLTIGQGAITKDEVVYLLTMLGVKRSVFGNLDKVVVAPYRAELFSQSTLERLNVGSARRKLLEVFGLSQTELNLLLQR